ncbi:integration host factor, actinobacterial type [Streptomyces sp. NBC_01538]|uniref:integration host factor, actinobacterial type n=1 Tax=Streptomyces sp. NBC_01538 TaxID=2903897 RepID=UPI0038690FFC
MRSVWAGCGCRRFRRTGWDPIVGKAYVRRLLESLPGICKVRAGQLLADLDISERRRVQGLGARQKERLLELFPPRT